MPDPSKIEEIEEPGHTSVIVPTRYIGQVMETGNKLRRGVFEAMD